LVGKSVYCLEGQAIHDVDEPSERMKRIACMKVLKYNQDGLFAKVNGENIAGTSTGHDKIYVFVK
jgi:hypothetical protein